LLFGLNAKRRVFVSYHHGGDQPYYNAFSQAFSDRYDVITDRSLERRIDSENVDYVMQRIRQQFITGTSCTIVLVGRDTWRRKYVDWEIKATLEKQHGLLGVRLPTAIPDTDGNVPVPARLHANILSGYALWVSWAELTASAQACTNFIEQANARENRLIDNSLERRLRNG
jgi:hypothetical protein